MSSKSNLLEKDGEACIIEEFYQDTKASELMSQIYEMVPWQERSIKIFGRLILQPRLMLWMGDSDCTYKYSGTIFKPHPWTELVLNIKKDIEAYTKYTFNSALLNLYRDENDSMGAHSDDEKELGDDPTIASLSLGATRPFIIKHKKENLKYKLKLKNGSLLMMKANMQSHWKHELPKLKKPIAARINITFRKIVLS